MAINEVQELYTKKAPLYHFLFVGFLGLGRGIEKFLRQSDFVQPYFKILDAGCGTGNATRALYTIACEKGYKDVTFHAFDFTQAMLDVFRRWIKKVGDHNITLIHANVLDLDQLPRDWNNYDRIISSAMLEHLPKDNIRQALIGLKQLLRYDGKLLVVITKRTFITESFIIRQLWKTNAYDENELRKIFKDAGFSEVKIRDFFWRSMFVVEAKAGYK